MVKPTKLWKNRATRGGYVMAEKRVKTKEVFEYLGKCPRCGIPQQSETLEEVDTVCDSCSIEMMSEIISNRIDKDSPVGSIVFDSFTDQDGGTHYAIFTPQLNIIRGLFTQKHAPQTNIEKIIWRYEAPENQTIDHPIVKMWKNLLKK